VEFDEFVATRLEPLLRFSAALTADRQLAEDVVQEVLARAHSHWRRIGDLEHPEAYVRRMIVNEFTSWRRKWARIVPRPDTELDTPVDDGSARWLQARVLLDEIAQLPPKQRAVIALRYYEDLSDPEIAELMGCAETTVRGYAFRAMRTLRIELTPAKETA
jgi:RNA polymerase sigma-70 factor (sigma-E family)